MDAKQRALIRKLNTANEPEEEEQMVPKMADSTALVEVEDEFLSGQELHGFFKFLKLPAERVEEMKLTPVQARRLLAHVASLRTGTHATVPLICAGAKCPFMDTCPFTEYNTQGEVDLKISVWPILAQCPIESNVLARKIMDLAVEYDVGPDDVTDIAILTKLAELDIYDHRLSMVLAKDEAQWLLREEVSHIDENSNVHMTLKEHPAFGMKERIHRMRKDLLKEMLGTRREKAKVLDAGDEVTDLVKQTARLASKVRNLLEAENAEIIEGEAVEYGD